MWACGLLLLCMAVCTVTAAPAIYNGFEVLDCVHLLVPEPGLDAGHWRIQAALPSAPDWLKGHLAARNYHLCVAHTGDKAYAEAMFPQEPSRRRRLLQDANATAVPQAAKTDLQQIATTSVGNMKVAVDATKTDLSDPNKAKNTSAGGVPAWQQRLNQQRQATKDKLNAEVDKAFDQAQDKIAALPEPAQDPAVDIFSQGMDVVSDGISDIIQEFSKIFDEIANLIKGIFNAIYGWAQEAYNTLSGATNTIVGIFG